MQNSNHNEDQGGLDDIHDTLAMAICMQLSEEFHHMMKRLNVHHRPLTSETYVYYQKHLFPAVVKDRRELNLYNHIINTYSKYVEILKSRKSYMEGIEQDG